MIDHLSDIAGKQALLTSFATTDPAAGTVSTYTVPTGQVFKFLSWRVAFTTSATVANRSVFLTIKDPSGNITAKFYSGTTQAASTTNTHQFSADLGYTNAGGTGSEITNGVPDNIVLPAGWQITLTVNNLDAGDDFGVSRIVGLIYT